MFWVHGGFYGSQDPSQLSELTLAKYAYSIAGTFYTECFQFTLL